MDSDQKKIIAQEISEKAKQKNYLESEMKCSDKVKEILLDDNKKKSQILNKELNKGLKLERKGCPYQRPTPKKKIQLN